MKRYKFKDSLWGEINKRQYKIGVEIGVHLAKNAAWLLENTCLEKLYLIDPWAGHFYRKRGMTPEWRYEKAMERLKPFQDRTVILRTTSAEAVRWFGDGFFDFIFIDARHHYQFIMEDLINWWPKCREGGLFTGHDYHNRHENGVKRAVDEFFGEKEREFQVVKKEKCPTWYLEK